jgi:hypothetical protein
MDDADRMHLTECVRELRPDADRRFDRQRAIGEARLEIATAQQLQHAVRTVDHVLDQIERLDDIRVLERVDRVRFLKEARDVFLAVGELGSQRLDRDDTTEAGVPSDVDVAHAAFAEQAHELVRAELTTNTLR